VLFRQLLFATTLGMGFAIVWPNLVQLVAAVFSDGRSPAGGESLVLKGDGTALIAFNGPKSVTTYRDLKGRLANTPGARDWLSATTLRAARENQEVPWPNRLKAFAADSQTPTNWYFVHDGRPQGGGYFVGYDRRTKRPVAYGGRNGFRSQPIPPAEWIPVSSSFMEGSGYRSSWSVEELSVTNGRLPSFRGRAFTVPAGAVYVPSENRVYVVDLSSRTIRTVLEASEAIESLSVTLLGWSWPKEISTRGILLLARTKSKIYACNRENAVRGVFNIPIADRENALLWYEAPTGEAVVVSSRARTTSDAGPIWPQTIYHLTADGAIRETEEIALKATVRPRAEQVLIQLMLPEPVVLVALGLFHGDNSVRGPWRTADTVLPLAVVVALALALAVSTWRRGAAYAISRTEQTVWTIFVFLFGPVGYLGYRLHRRWPVVEKCPSCAAEAPRDRSECPACHSRFPAPTMNGTEVLA
jgi:hypothetical protein